MTFNLHKRQVDNFARQGQEILMVHVWDDPCQECFTDYYLQILRKVIHFKLSKKDKENNNPLVKKAKPEAKVTKQMQKSYN